MENEMRFIHREETFNNLAIRELIDQWPGQRPAWKRFPGNRRRWCLP